MKTKSQSKDSKGAPILVYCGPSVMGLTTRTILGKSLPKHVQEMARKCPELERMIVPLDRFSETVKAVGRRGSNARADAIAIIRALRR